MAAPRSLEALASICSRLTDRRKDDRLYSDVAAQVRSAARGDAVALVRFNPVSGQHETVVNLDYPKPVIHHLNTWFVRHDEAFRYMRTYDRKPLRWRDMPFPYETMYSAERVFRPSGFNEGVTVCLYSAEGDYTGSLHVSIADRNALSDDSMSLLNALQTVLGNAVDWWGSLDESATSEGARIVIGADRKALFGPPPSEADPDITGLVRDRLVPALPRRFDAVPGTSYHWYRGSTYVVRARAKGGMLVLDVSPGGLPIPLTEREIDVATLLTYGLSNPDIAAALHIAPKTAARHVENIVAKIGALSRVDAAVKCASLGLRNWRTPDDSASPVG